MSKPRHSRTKRTAVLLRLDPDLARWLQAAADQQGRSRTKLIELWLAALKDEVHRLEGDTAADPHDAAQDLGTALVQRLIEFGMAGQLVRWSWLQRKAALALEAQDIEDDKQRKPRRES